MKILNKSIKSGKHLEITNLIINDLNDSFIESRQLVNFISQELDPAVSLHFSRVFPHYKMQDILPTREETLLRAEKNR